MPRRVKVLIAFGILSAITISLLVGFRIFGLIRPFYIPSGSMTPAVSPGDHIVMEGFSYLEQKPERGDIVVFGGGQTPFLKDNTLYIKRIVGLPQDHLQISNDDFYVNGKLFDLTNKEGRIHYIYGPASGYLGSSNDVVVVPDNHYFLLGDNSTNSLDSRYFGFIPRESLKGKIWLCYWPLRNAGIVK